MLLKKIMLCGLMTSQIAFAGGMGQACEDGSCQSENQKSWEIGVDALYVRPALSNFSHLGSTNLGHGGDLSADRYFQQDMNWGVRAEGSVFFDNNVDAKLALSDLSNSSKGNFLINFGLVDDGIDNDAVLAKSRVKWSDVVFELGQTQRFMQNKFVRFYGGLEYSSIDVNLDQYTTNINGTANILQEYKFDGVGPRVGLDAFYNVVDGFNLYAKGSTAVLVGSSTRSDRQSFSTDPRLPVATGKRANSTVPVIGIDLGANYEFEFDYGLFTIQGGWRLTDYINALASAGDSSNFSIQGPYLGLKWAGLAA